MSGQRLVPIRNRVSNGQRATVCGLVLVGVPFPEACSIAGVRSGVMTPYVGKDWTVRTQRPSRWTLDQVEALAEVWRDPNIKVAQIAASFGVCVEQIWRVATKHNLGHRPTWKAVNPRSVAQQPKETRLRYRRKRNVYGAARARELLELGLL